MEQYRSAIDELNECINLRDDFHRFPFNGRIPSLTYQDAINKSYDIYITDRKKFTKSVLFYYIYFIPTMNTYLGDDHDFLNSPKYSHFSDCTKLLIIQYVRRGGDHGELRHIVFENDPNIEDFKDFVKFMMLPAFPISMSENQERENLSLSEFLRISNSNLYKAKNSWK